MGRVADPHPIYDRKADSAREYWLRVLSTDCEDAIIPTDHSSGVQNSIGDSLALTIPGVTFERLTRLTADSPFLLYVTLLTAVKVCLYKYSRSNVITVGGPSRNIEGEPLYPIHALAIVDNVEGEMSFRTLLLNIRETVVEAYQYQGYPLGDCVNNEEFGDERQFRPQVLLAVKDFHGDTSALGSDLRLRFERDAFEVRMTADFDQTRFSLDFIQRFVRDALNILSLALEDTTVSINHLVALTPVERRQMLLDWNNTCQAFPENSCVHELFVSQVSHTPEAIAIAYDDQHLSYLELNRKANQLSHYLIKRGIEPERRVALCLERGPELVISILGCLKAGGVYVPLDPNYPPARLGYMLNDAQVTMLLTQRHLLTHLTSVDSPVVCLDEEWGRIGEESEREPVSGVISENLAYVIYTSGSTGRPKGVMVAHKGLCNLVEAQKDAFRLGTQSRVLQFASLSFDASASEIFCTLAAGGSIQLYSQDDLLPGDDLARVLREDQITTATLPPTVLAVLSQEGLVHLETVIAAGEACATEIVERWARGRRFLDAYGPTEATVCASIGECKAGSNKKPTIGRPIANTRLYILDREMEPVPVGVRGELFIAGVGVARGYWGKPDLTAERFIPNVFALEEGERGYWTGDVVRYLSDGQIDYVGRVDDQIKVRGYRIELGEIENVMNEQPGVRQAAVIAREDEPGQKRLIAYVVTDLTAEGVKAAQPGNQDEIELWPSVAEYFVYDDALYYAMTHDDRRNLSYRVAIDRNVKDKVVLDIGTGADAILARMCVESGAKKVYAIELLDETYQKAKALIARLGLENRIELIHGDSTKIQLPERVDICVSEIVGSIGGCEGAGRILNNAQRFLKSPGGMIPCRSATLIAAARLPETLRFKPRFSVASGYYTEKIFEQLGYSFDLRLCVKNFPIDHVISGEAVFEDLDFNRVNPDEESHEITLTITEHTTLDGFLIWLTLYTAPDQVIDILKSPHSWLPVFFPAFYPGLEVEPGDEIKAVCSRRPCTENQTNPDYQIEGKVIRRKGGDVSFCYRSPHFQKSFKATPFYQELFSDESSGQIEGNRVTKSIAVDLRRAIERRLPKYMVPSAIVLMDQLPLAPNGKLDRKALPAPEFAQIEVGNEYVAARTPEEAVLVGIFQKVLKRDRVGIHDNFFELGGDSILSIQIISRANEAGLGLAPKQLFQHQTIAELAAAAGTGGKTELESESVVGEAPLTPIQEWFFEGNDQEPEHCNQAVMLEAREDLEAELLREVLRQLVKQHDVLRHVFKKTQSGWGQLCKGVDEFDENASFEEIDISDIDESLESRAIEEAAEKYQKMMNLGEGPLLKVAVFGGGGRRQRILMIAHHLVMDGVSWRILLGDLERGYEQARKGERIKLGPKTTSYKRWAERLKEEAQSEKSRAEAGYWLAEVGKIVGGLPMDKRGANTAASCRNVVTTLDEERTATLLQEVARAYKTQIHEVLLCALARSVSEWSKERTVLVDVEGHGREEIVNDVDLTRTVGWFTTLYPLALTVRGENSVELLRNVKEQVREANRRGIYYGMLKYLSEEFEIREKLRGLPQAEISFNYLGQLDLVLSEGTLFRGAKESTGETRSRKEKRRHLIEINGSVRGGRLQVVWTYSENLHHRETIEAVAELAMEALREVVAGSRSTNEQPYTPSDFPLARLDQPRLDRLMSVGRNLEDIYSLSPLQKAMLFHTISGLNPQALFVQLTCNLRGKIDLPAFKKTWQRLLERTPILRTAFEWEDLEEPAQVVHRRVDLPIDYLDWGNITKEEQERRYEALIETDCWRGFDLSTPPLMRLSLVRLGEDLYRLIWSHHHILLDGWSSTLILKDIFSFYEAYQRGEEPLVKESSPYKVYIGWLKRQDLQKSEAYWRKRLKGFSRPTKLWLDRGTGKPTNREEVFEDQKVNVSRVATAKLQSFAKQHHLTINTILQGAWGLLLSKYSGEHDLIFGTTVSGRPVDLPGSESIVGPFINTLPVRMKIPSQTSILSWLHEIQSDQIESGQYSYNSLVEQYGEVPLGSPLYESILIFENYPLEQSSPNQDSRLEISDVRAPVRTKFPLTLVSGAHSKLLLSIAYDSRRFDRPEISRLLAHLQNIIEGIVNNPEQSISSLSPFSQTEKDQMLAGWRGAKRIDPDEWSIHQRFEAQADNTPDAIALVFGHEQLTYRELNMRANQLAAYLQKLGVGPEVRVGIYARPSAEFLVGLLAIIKAGGACVTIEPADQEGGAASLSLSQDIGASVLLTQCSLVAEGPEVKAEIVRLDSDWEAISSQSKTNPACRVKGENLAFVSYTSGSTGARRRVMVTHRGWRNHLLAMEEAIGLTQEDRVLIGHGMCVGVSPLDSIRPLLAGGRLVIANPASYENGGSLWDLICSQKITTANFTPSIFSAVLTVENLENGGALKRIILSGETLWRPIQERASARLNVSLHNSYSVTEASGAITHEVCGPRLDSGIAPAGRPLANIQIYLLDAHLHLVPAGVAGEVWVSGEGVARGYLDQPELTAECFMPNPFSRDPGERMFGTKDLARYLPDGKIEVLARNEHRIRGRFNQIEPAAIESVLMAYPGIDQAALLPVGDAVGNTRLSAYLGCHQDSAPTAEVLKEYLRERFSAQTIPTSFLWLKRLPLTSNGRIDRNALTLMKSAATNSRITPANEVAPYEEILSAIWAELLGVDEVGREDNFFEVGGHSLLATQLMSRVREVFNVEIPLRCVFEQPTAQGLAQRIKEKKRAGEKDQASPIVRASRVGRMPLSFAQQRLWFLDQLVPNNPFYNCPGAVRLEGRLDLEALERVVNEIVRRHEALRTRFEVEDGAPVQVIDPWRRQPLEVEDLSCLETEEREEEVRKIIREEAETGFDLSRGPLLRVKVVKLGEEQHALLFTLHHIVSDRWSMGVMVREVGTLYQAFSAGEPSPLEELPIQYADFAVWQREYLAGGVLDREIAYWKERLKDAAVMELPTDHVRPAAPSYRGGSERVEIGKELSEGLRRLSQREGATLFMVLMAAFKVLLMKYTGGEDLSVGTVIANRTRREVEGLIGFFVNTLVMRTGLGGNPRFRELIEREREVALGAYAHQEVPFEKLVEEINPGRDLSRSPLFQVMMALQNTGREALEISGLRVRGMGEDTGVAKFDLTLTLTETVEGIVGALEYSRDLYEVETIRRMATHFEKLVAEVTRDAEQRINEIEVMREGEKRQIIEEWNETEKVFGETRFVHTMIAEWASRRPDGLAIICEQEQITYQELNERSNRLANYLREFGVGPDVMVGVCLERSIEMVIGLLGILKAGGAYLPMDPTYPDSRLRTMIDDAKTRLILTQENLADRCSAGAVSLICLDRDWRIISTRSPKELHVDVNPDNAAYIIYTSGSTGRPKGVIVTHANVRNLFNAVDEKLQMNERDVWTMFHSYSFDFSVWEMWGALMYGGRLVVAPYLVARAPDEFYDLVRKEGVTILSQTPSAFRHFMKVDDIDGGDRGLSLRAVIFGGEALEFQSLRGWVERRGDEFPQLVNMYGITETTVHTTFKKVTKDDLRGSSGSDIGKPMANMRMYVLNEQTQSALVGTVGELYVGGGGMARGYLGRAELTAERFIPDPFYNESGARVYKTGDLVRYLDDGNIEYIGRKDDQVKIRGYRIELREIETALREHKWVRQSVVIAVDGERGDKRLIGYVMGDEGAVTSIELRRFLRERLPDYMVPETIMILESMPLTANDKIDRKRLPTQSDSPQQMEESFVAPRDVLELQLARIWERILGIHPIGVTDNFFDLGGHSILAVSLIEKIRSDIGLQLPLSALFQGGTIEHVAAVLRREASSKLWSCLVELQVSGSQQPLFFAHPAGGNVLCYFDLARCLGADHPFYAFQTPGFYGERSLFTRIEDMAAHYIEAMRATQPEGPYFLGGWSLGAVVAYEMAQQLVAQGQRVGQLFLLDCSAMIPTEESIEEEVDDAAKLLKLLSPLLPISEEDLQPFQGDARIDFILKKAISVKLLPPDVEVARARAYLKVYRTNVRALCQYVPQVYPGAVTLFRSTASLSMPSSNGFAHSELITKMIQDPTRGWGRLAAGGVRVIDVPGDHTTMASSPHVEILAMRIRDCLNGDAAVPSFQTLQQELL